MGTEENQLLDDLGGLHWKMKVNCCSILGQQTGFLISLEICTVYPALIQLLLVRDISKGHYFTSKGSYFRNCYVIVTNIIKLLLLSLVAYFRIRLLGLFTMSLFTMDFIMLSFLTLWALTWDRPPERLVWIRRGCDFGLIAVIGILCSIVSFFCPDLWPILDEVLIILASMWNFPKPDPDLDTVKNGWEFRDSLSFSHVYHELCVKIICRWIMNCLKGMVQIVKNCLF